MHIFIVFCARLGHGHMNMNKKSKYIIAVILFCVIITTAVFIPDIISRYYDMKIVGTVYSKEKSTGETDYTLDINETLHLLSNSLNNRILPQSDRYAAVRWQDILNNKNQSCAFQPVYRESEFNSETRKNALQSLKTELKLLYEKGILPEFDFDPGGNYIAALFSAIDILNPQKNVTVWQIDFDGHVIKSGLADCITDARTNKIYSVSVRAAKKWGEYDTDKIIKQWAEYLGIDAPVAYEPENPLIEDATYYKKYISGKTVLTVGYYEGVGEFFIKITE